MSTDEQLSVYGHTYASSIYANFMLTIAEKGIQCFMFFYILSLYLATPRASRKSRTPYVIVSGLIFLLSTAAASLDGYWLFSLFSRSSSWTEFLTLGSVDDSEYRMEIASHSLSTVWVALGEGMLLYRCYLILYDFRWVTVVPALLYLSVIGTDVASIISDVAGLPSSKLSTAWVVLVVCANIIITFLILSRLLYTRLNLEKALPGQTFPAYTAIAAILIESAAPLAILGLINAALFGSIRLGGERSFESKRKLYASQTIIEGLFYSFLALSPQMIIFKVATGRSWTKPSDTTGEGLTRSLAFAQSNHLTQTTDVESNDDSHLRRYSKSTEQ